MLEDKDQLSKFQAIPEDFVFLGKTKRDAVESEEE